MTNTNNILSAMDCEYKSLQLYSNLASIYKVPLAPIIDLKQAHINTLASYLQNANETVPSNAYVDANFNLSGDLLSDLGLLIQNENENIALYNTLIENEADPVVKDSFYLFQAHSFNEILPALETVNSTVNSINSNTVANELTKAKSFLTEANATLNKLQNNQLSQAELEGFLSKINFSLLGGAVLGALGAFLLNELTNKKE